MKYMLITLALALCACGTDPHVVVLTKDTTAPELHVGIIDTTRTTMTLEFQSDEDAELWYNVDGSQYGPVTIEKRVAYTPVIDGFECGTTHTVKAWAVDASENFSFDEFVYPVTRACAAPQPTITASLSYINVTSVGGTAVMEITGAKSRGACLIYGRNTDGSAWYWGSTTCAKGQNYTQIWLGLPFMSATYFFVFRNEEDGAISNDATITTKNENEMVVSVSANTSDGFDLLWQGSKQYTTVEVACWLSDFRWTQFDQNVSTLQGIASFRKLLPATYSCRAYGSTYHPTYGWSTESSATLRVTVTLGNQLIITNVPGTNGSPTKDFAVIVGTTDQPGVSAKLTPTAEPTKLRKLTIENTCGAAVQTVRNIKVLDGNNQVIAQAASLVSTPGRANSYYTWNATDNLLASPVATSTPAYLHITYDVADAGTAVLGDCVKLAITEVAAVGAITGENALVVGTAAATGKAIVVPFSVTITADPTFSGGTMAVNAGSRIAGFKVVNNGNAKIELRTTNYTDTGTHNSNSVLLYSEKYSDENSSNYNAYTAVSAPSVAFGNLATYFTINGGAYRNLAVTIGQAGLQLASGDSWQLSVTKLGDVTYCVTEVDLGFDANGDGLITGKICDLPVEGTPTCPGVTKG